MLGVHAQELLLPGFDFPAERIFEAQALVFPLLRLLAELVDQFGLVGILRMEGGWGSGFRWTVWHNSMNEYFTTTDALFACDEA